MFRLIYLVLVCLLGIGCISGSTTAQNNDLVSKFIPIDIELEDNTDITLLLQKQMDDSDKSTIRLANREYRLTKTIIIPSGKILEGGQATITYSGFGPAFKIGEGEISWRSSVSNLNLVLAKNGAIGFDASWARLFDMQNCVIKLQNSNQIGIYLKGIPGKSPYQNTFSTSYISGDIKYKNQIGIQLVDGKGLAKASGPNRNLFTSFKQIASVTIGVDIQSGDGNIFSSINTENITECHFRLNDVLPIFRQNASSGTLNSITFNKPILTNKSGQIIIVSGSNQGFTSRVIQQKGKTIFLERPAKSVFDRTSMVEFYESNATNNIITNTASEARSTSTFAKFHLGAESNYFKNNYLTSTSSLKFERECQENSNQIGEENYLVFNLKNLPDGKKMHRVTPSYGFVMPFTGYISGVTATASNLGKKGNVEVVLKKSGISINELKTSLNSARNISTMKYLQEFDTTSAAFAKAGQRVSIEVNSEGAINAAAEIMIGVTLTRI